MPPPELHHKPNIVAGAASRMMTRFFGFMKARLPRLGIGLAITAAAFGIAAPLTFLSVYMAVRLSTLTLPMDSVLPAVVYVLVQTCFVIGWLLFDLARRYVSCRHGVAIALSIFLPLLYPIGGVPLLAWGLWTSPVIVGGALLLVLSIAFGWSRWCARMSCQKTSTIRQ